MDGLEHVPIQPKETAKQDNKPSEKVGEDLPEGDFDIPMERAREAAREDSSGFSQAQQFIQAIRGEEKRQQQKEQELAALLKDYIQKAGNEELFTTLIALLDRNVLASLLVAALTLRDQSLKEAILAQLPTAEREDSDSAPIDSESTSRSLAQQFGANQWDPRVKPRIEQWLYTMRELCATYPKRLLKDLSHENREADALFQIFLRQIMEDFFARQEIPADTYQLKIFSEAVVQRLIEQMAKQVNDQKLI